MVLYFLVQNPLSAQEQKYKELVNPEKKDSTTTSPFFVDFSTYLKLVPRDTTKKIEQEYKKIPISQDTLKGIKSFSIDSSGLEGNYDYRGLVNQSIDSILDSIFNKEFIYTEASGQYVHEEIISGKGDIRYTAITYATTDEKGILVGIGFSIFLPNNDVDILNISIDFPKKQIQFLGFEPKQYEEVIISLQKQGNPQGKQ